MDFLDPKKRQAHVRRLFIGYFLMGIAIALASTIMVILSNGYDLDRKTGKVIQNGLIFAATQPTDSNIFLNGKDQGRTDKRLTVPAGKYDFEYRQAGYTAWKKTITLNGGSIERLSYAKLFPTKLESVDAKTYTNLPQFSTQSPDRRWIMVARQGSLRVFDIFDTSKPTAAPAKLDITGELLNDPQKKEKESLELVEWSTDNRHVLVKHSYGKKNEFIVIDRQNQNSYNLNAKFKVDPARVTLRDKKFDQLYLYFKKDGVLQQANLKDLSAKTVLKNVLTYKAYKADTLVYTVTNPSSDKKIDAKILKSSKSYVIRSLDTGDAFVDMADYDGSNYIAVATASEDKIFIYKDFLTKVASFKSGLVDPYFLIRMNDPLKIAFSANTRFLSAQSGSNFSVYDFEEDRRFNFKLDQKIDEANLASWMDGHRLVINSNNTVKAFEFDGQNQTDLGQASDGTMAYFDQDYKRLYTFGQAKDGKKDQLSLARTSLVYKLNP